MGFFKGEKGKEGAQEKDVKENNSRGCAEGREEKGGGHKTDKDESGAQGSKALQPLDGEEDGENTVCGEHESRGRRKEGEQKGEKGISEKEMSRSWEGARWKI